MKRRHWTKAEVDLLRAMYPHAHAADVAAWLGVNVRRVYNAAKAHGVRKTTEYLRSAAAGRIGGGGGGLGAIGSRFKPGNQPWNKGLHYQAGGRSIETQFKPGRPPETQANYLPIGSHRINRDGHLERKVTDDRRLVPARRWTPVARLVWEAEHGPTPARHLVVFKPGQRTAVLEEITTARLECISMAENARRNHPANKSPELARLVQLKGAITRQVNRINREHQQRSTS